jgi:AGZA family xanthine/uracil permease-like MFS transporter
MIIAILAVTAVSLALGISDFGGVFSLPPSLAPTFMRMDVASALESGLVAVILAFLIIDLFDTAGTLIGLAQRSGLLDAQGRLPRFWPIAAPPSSAPLWGPRRRPATSKAPPASTPAAAPG